MNKKENKKNVENLKLWKNIFKKYKYKSFGESCYEFMSFTWVYFVSALVVMIGGMLFIDIVAPKSYLPMQFIDVFGFPVAAFVPTLLFVAVGVGWMLHGVGFLLVRR